MKKSALKRFKFNIKKYYDKAQQLDTNIKLSKISKLM